MICKTCNTRNLESATYCRSCGSVLYSSYETIPDKFPEYEFIPTSLIRIPGNRNWRFIVAPYCLILLIAACFYDSYFGAAEVAGTIGALIEVVITLILACFISKKTHPIDISNIADYIEDSKYLLIVKDSLFGLHCVKNSKLKFREKSSKYLLIVKDNLFGLYNTKKRKIQIPCKYNYLSWKSLENTLVATLDNDSKVTIDIFGNILK